MKRAFTLVELLVVIAIIGILIGVFLTVSGGSIENARATKCLANLRSLAAAANAVAMQEGKYPTAGSREGNQPYGGVRTYNEIPGWISWLSCDGQFGDGAAGRQKDGAKGSFVKVDVCPYLGTGDTRRDRWALENGAIWAATGKSRDIYVCPSHRKKCQTKNLGSPLFSYVMNAYFLYDTTQGSGDMGYTDQLQSEQKPYGGLGRADKILLFADIDAGEDEAGTGTAKGTVIPRWDCTLNYRATVNGVTYGSEWKGDPESIGFTHLDANKRKCAHVVFADGHTEKIILGREKGKLDRYQLTALLCEGRSYTFKDGGYEAQKFTEK